MRAKTKARRIEQRTVFILRSEEVVGICKQPGKGLLADLYELPNVIWHLTRKEAMSYCERLGISPIQIEKLSAAKHIFTHLEWQLIGYKVLVDELGSKCGKGIIFVKEQELSEKYPIPIAFESYLP